MSINTNYSAQYSTKHRNLGNPGNQVGFGAVKLRLHKDIENLPVVKIMLDKLDKLQAEKKLVSDSARLENDGDIITHIFRGFTSKDEGRITKALRGIGVNVKRTAHPDLQAKIDERTERNINKEYKKAFDYLQ
jgi:hypothetical protein